MCGLARLGDRPLVAVSLCLSGCLVGAETISGNGFATLASDPRAEHTGSLILHLPGWSRHSGCLCSQLSVVRRHSWRPGGPLQPFLGIALFLILYSIPFCFKEYAGFCFLLADTELYKDTTGLAENDWAKMQV